METDIHKWLKKLALTFLKEKGMNIVCKETPIGKYSADALGLNMRRKEIRIIEAKQSRGDFLKAKCKLQNDAGYYLYAHYTYIICPENLIKPEEVASNIGLLYAKIDDTVEVVKRPVKNTHRLKSLFDTVLRNAVHRLSNEVFYQDEKQYKDETDHKFSRNAKIFYSAIRCPQCKHVTKELINDNIETIKCSYCKELIEINKTKVRIITGYNQKFIDKINKLKSG